MKFVLLLFALGAAATAGYAVGDEGEFGWSAGIASALVLVALLIWAILPGPAPKATVSLRPSSQVAARLPAGRPLHPGDAARTRERERVLANGPTVGLRLLDSGRNQIAVIKVLRNYLDLGLKDAKEISDAAKKGTSPLVIAEMAVERAREFAEDLENAGGVVEFQEPPASQ